MAAKRRQDKQLHGLLGELSPGVWVLSELHHEASRIEMDAEEGTRPVSVRLNGETVALLDAFADRFSVSRSSMLNRLIHGGLAEAFRSLPGHEQQRLWDTVKVSWPVGEMTFSEMFAAAKASGDMDEIPVPTQSPGTQPATAVVENGAGNSLPGIFGSRTPQQWVQDQLEWESTSGARASLDDDRVPVSVRLTADAIALLDAFALRFNLSRSGMLLRLIRGGLGQSYRVLPESEQKRMLTAVRVRVPNFAKSWAERAAEMKATSGAAPKDGGTASRKRRGRAAKDEPKA